MSTPKNNSVIKAFEILKLLSSNGRAMPPQEIAISLNITLSTTHRFLLTLEQVGAVSRSSGNRYRLGILISELGQNAGRGEILADRARAHIQRLAEEIGASTSLFLFNRNTIDKIVWHEPHGNLIYREKKFDTKELAFSSVGKLFLSGLQPITREEQLKILWMKPLTPHSVSSLSQLRKQLIKIQDDNLAIEQEEVEIGLDSISIPVPNLEGNIQGAIKISGPSQRLRYLRDDIIKKMYNTSISVTRHVFEEAFTIVGKALPRGSFPHVKRAGGILFVSGTSSRCLDNSFAGYSKDRNDVEHFNAAEQIQESFNNVLEIIGSMGSGKADLVSIFLYITNKVSLKIAEEEIKSFQLLKHTVIHIELVDELPHPHQIVMIKAHAKAPNGSKKVSH